MDYYVSVVYPNKLGYGFVSLDVVYIKNSKMKKLQFIEIFPIFPAYLAFAEKFRGLLHCI